MSVIVHGETDEERESFVLGYRMGMMAALAILQQMSSEAGEIIGECPAPPYREAVNRVSIAIPQGHIKASYTVE